MGKFALEFSKISYIPQKTTTDDHEKDSLLQRSIAFAAYYNMIFIAACAFMPAKVAIAAETLTGFIY